MTFVWPSVKPPTSTADNPVVDNKAIYALKRGPAIARIQSWGSEVLVYENGLVSILGCGPCGPKGPKERVLRNVNSMSVSLAETVAWAIEYVQQTGVAEGAVVWTSWTPLQGFSVRESAIDWESGEIMTLSSQQTGRGQWEVWPTTDRAYFAVSRNRLPLLKFHTFGAAAAWVLRECFNTGWTAEPPKPRYTCLVCGDEFDCESDAMAPTPWVCDPCKPIVVAYEGRTGPRLRRIRELLPLCEWGMSIAEIFDDCSQFDRDKILEARKAWHALTTKQLRDERETFRDLLA